MPEKSKDPFQFWEGADRLEIPRWVILGRSQPREILLCSKRFAFISQGQVAGEQLNN